MKNLKERTLRGGAVRAVAQAANFVLRIGSTAILARMLEPRDFGLVGMVTAMTGVLALMKDAGLSLPTVQQISVNDQQLSNLFWINVLVGVVLTLLSCALAPFVEHFYHEPKLFWVTVCLAPSFFLASLGVQHSAILQRQMRFSACAAIDLATMLISSALGILMAIAGYGYWSLVAMALAIPAVGSIGAWLIASWVPSRPRRGSQIRAMVKLGGALTFNNIVVYVAYNLDKVLLGKYWGADAIGSYGRAYQLISIPTDNLNAAIGGVALSALARLQTDAARLKAYFLKGYSLVLALTVPATVACAVFSEEIVYLVLGPKWGEAAVIVRYLSPTILVFALINPIFWLVFVFGLMGRSIKTALVIMSLVVCAYIVGLPYGPRGVAIAYSTTMGLWLVPHIVWCLHGTGIRPLDIARVAAKPLIAGVLAAAVCIAFRVTAGHLLSPVGRLVLGGGALTVTYVCILLYAFGQRVFYLDLIKSTFGKQPVAGVNEPV